MMLSTKRITMLTVSLGLFMDVLDANILNTAIPVMAKNLKVHPIDLKIALISYLLSLAIFIPISGWVADRFGTKRIFIAAMGLFTFSSFLCGYAHTLLELVFARSIQGLGGAFMISLGRLIIARTFARHQLVEAMNTVIIVVSLGVMLGPFVGGVITQHFSWPWIFWVNIPAGILGIALAWYGLEDKELKKKRPFDFLGFVLFGGSLALLCFALSKLSESNDNVRATVSTIAVAVCLLLVCLWHATKHPHPVINTTLFRFRTFRVSVFGNLFARLGFGGMPFLLPLLQQIGLGFSAQVSGLLLVPIAFGIVFAKCFAYRILRIIGYKRYLIGNTLCLGLVLAAFQTITLATPLVVIAGLTFTFGTFTAAQYTGMNSLAFAEISKDDLSASTSITSTTQVLAQTLGVAVSAILLRFFASFLEDPNHMTTAVFHHAFLGMSIMTLLAVFVFIGLKTDDGQQMLEEKGTDLSG